MVLPLTIKSTLSSSNRLIAIDNNNANVDDDDINDDKDLYCDEDI
jgi:hypothetical protein